MDADVIYLGAEGVIFQERSNNCGLAALAMVLEHYGIKVSQQSMAGGAKLDFRGASLMTLKERATLEGLEAEGRRLSYEDLLSIRFPAILFVENHHFIVVDSVGGTGELFVRDPAAGRLRVSRKRAAAIWKGETLVITHQGG
jgi:ATP-binding cassette subfamily B protein RaxB